VGSGFAEKHTSITITVPQTLKSIQILPPGLVLIFLHLDFIVCKMQDIMIELLLILQNGSEVE
jgi:hypothetical protein